MATMKETRQAFADLANGLFDLVEDGRFPADDAKIFSAEAVAVVGASRRFFDQPASGDESDTYDAPLKAARDAIQVAHQAEPGGLQPLRDGVRHAIEMLRQVTAGEIALGAEGRQPECCRHEFDAQESIRALSKDVTRLADALSTLQPAGEPPAFQLRRAPGIAATEDPRLAPGDDRRVRRIINAAPDQRDALLRSARLLVGLGDLARGQRPAAAPHELTRIVGGDAAQLGSFLHCVCVGDPEQWMCTGALVADRVVLTAAHCGPDVTRVMIGGNHVAPLDSGARVVDVNVVRIHPDYRPAPYSEHDISVLILADPAGVDPVAIASTDEIADADSIQLVGFGYNDPQRPVGFGTKRQVEIDIPPIIRTSDDDGLANIEKLLAFHGEYEFVAGRKALGRDTCNGDSGGPAYIKKDRAYRLAGLTSRATREAQVNCGDGGIYVRPERFREWIDAVVREAGAEAISWN